MQHRLGFSPGARPGFEGYKGYGMSAGMKSGQRQCENLQIVQGAFVKTLTAMVSSSQIFRYIPKIPIVDTGTLVMLSCRRDCCEPL